MRSHMDQLAILRRLAGSPIPREYYMKAALSTAELRESRESKSEGSDQIVSAA